MCEKWLFFIAEREGVSHWHPARFILIGTMNPEEGTLRPHLLDRFGLCVQTSGAEDVGSCVEVMLRREAYDADPYAFERACRDQDARVTARGLGSDEVQRTLRGASHRCDRAQARWSIPRYRVAQRSSEIGAGLEGRGRREVQRR